MAGGSMTENDYLQALEKMKPGTSWRISYGGGNPNNRIIHVLAIVDDEQVVVKRWSRHRQRWVYSVECGYGLWLKMCAGTMTERRR